MGELEHDWTPGGYSTEVFYSGINKDYDFGEETTGKVETGERSG